MSTEVWRRRIGLWLPALLFFLLNLGGYLVYRTSYADETAGLESRIQSREGDLAQLEERRAALEALVERTQSNREQIDQLYQETFSTRRDRLTRVISEVRSLASRAGMDPPTISYPEEEIAGYALVERSFIFSVEGNYQQLRRFVNFLELSESFLALRRIALAGTAGKDDDSLRINLTLSTLFAEEGAMPAVEGPSS